MECKFEQSFDTKTKLQSINNMPSVIHCHHYTTLFTKVAMEMDHLSGTQFLSDSMEESFYIVFKRYFIKENILNKQERIDIIEQYFALSGMGKIKLEINANGGHAILEFSHLDEGWLKKFKADATQPINFLACGYIAAAFAVVNEKRLRSYTVKETESMAMGASRSRFEVTAN